MTVWILLVAAVVCAYLAYDAWRVAIPSKDIPYQVTAESLGENVAGVPLHEQQNRKRWHMAYGVGEGSSAVWLWAILALACVLGAAKQLTE